MPETAMNVDGKGNVITDMPTLDRLAYTAAAQAVREVMKEHITLEDIRKINQESINKFIENIFDVDPEDRTQMSNLRKDYAHLRASRDMKELIIRHGLRAVFISFGSGLVYSLWSIVKNGRIM